MTMVFDICDKRRNADRQDPSYENPTATAELPGHTWLHVHNRRSPIFCLFPEEGRRLAVILARGLTVNGVDRQMRFRPKQEPPQIGGCASVSTITRGASTRIDVGIEYDGGGWIGRGREGRRPLLRLSRHCCSLQVSHRCHTLHSSKTAGRLNGLHGLMAPSLCSRRSLQVACHV